MKGRGLREHKGIQKVRVNLTKVTMRIMLLLSIWLSSALRCTQSKIHLSAQEGGLVNISCPYDSGYETYPKYFCKGDYGKRQALANTFSKKVLSQKGKYYLCDDTKQRILHATIYNLNLNDGGTYWCEIDTYLFDPITEIMLRVYKAPTPLKPPLVTSNLPISTTVQAVTWNQQQSARTTESARSTKLWSTPTDDMHTVLSPLAVKELYLVVAAAAAAAAVLLLSLLVVLYFRLRKHRHDTAREFEREAGTWSMQPVNAENHSRGQLRELDPSVSVSSSDSMYAAVAVRRGQGTHTSICHAVTIQTRMANPNSSISSCLQDDAPAWIINQHEENICSVSTDAGHQHTSEDVHLLYSTVCFNTEGAAQPRGHNRSAAGPSEMYATIRHPKT